MFYGCVHCRRIEKIKKQNSFVEKRRKVFDTLCKTITVHFNEKYGENYPFVVSTAYAKS